MRSPVAPAPEAAPVPLGSSGPVPPPHALGVDIASLVVCSIIWGTTWFVITLQFGSVPIAWSVAYRFGLAALVLFAWSAATGRTLRLTRAQHGWALLQGFFVFTLNYGLVYAAEERVLSGVVAVIFASLALVNLIVFRIVQRRRASGLAWGGALLGLAGVGVLSISELMKADLQVSTMIGVGLALTGVLASAIGNLFAAKLQQGGVEVLPATGWAMGYGALVLALWALATGQAPVFDFSLRYVGSLLYLSVFGSVLAFVVYYALARRRSYTFASYTAALTPPTAMLVSTLFEGAQWGALAFAGLLLVIAGQALLIKAPTT